jgi:uncharacterized membrane protein
MDRDERRNAGALFLALLFLLLALLLLLLLNLAIILPFLLVLPTPDNLLLLHHLLHHLVRQGRVEPHRAARARVWRRRHHSGHWHRRWSRR